MKKRIDVNSPQFRDLVRSTVNLKLNLPPLSKTDVKIPVAKLEEQINFENLPKDVLFSLALQLDLPDLIAFCNLNKKSASVCPNVWRAKIIKDFPDFNFSNLPDRLKGISLHTLYSVLFVKKVLKDGTSGPVANPRWKPKTLEGIYYDKSLFLTQGHLKGILIKIPPLSLPNLEKLDLTRQLIENIPVLNLPYLRVLDLNYNQLQTFPPFDKMKNLEILSINDNLLHDLPSLKLPKLRRLYIRNNKTLKSLPIFDLPQIEDLFLEDNSLENIDNIVLSNLPKLQKLSLSNNQLQNVPILVNSPRLGLSELSLDGNKLKNVDNILQFDLPNLRYINLTNNNFSEADKKKLSDKYSYLKHHFVI